jgi:hypothetical protein
MAEIHLGVSVPVQTYDEVIAADIPKLQDLQQAIVAALAPVRAEAAGCRYEECKF